MVLGMLTRALLTCVLVASLVVAGPPASATTVTVAGFQMYPGGYVSIPAPGAVRVTEGPLVSHHFYIQNLDPVAHRFVECSPCDPPEAARVKPGATLDVTVPVGETAIVYVDVARVYELFDPAFPWMRARVRT